MTRNSPREIEHRLQNLERVHRPDDDWRGPSQTVYRDPVTGRCFEGFGTDADPVENIPDGANLLIMRRTMSMMRSEAEERGWEVLDVLDDRGDRQVVSVRVEPDPEVDVEAAVTVPEDEDAPLIDFSETQT